MVTAINEVNIVTANTGVAYGESSEKYEELADKKLNKSDTLILCGHGACIKVERNALIVKNGYTHKEQKPVTHVLYRGVSGIKSIVILSDICACLKPGTPTHTLGHGTAYL